MNENWDIVKEWNEQEWDLYFRIFGQAVARPADAISKGLAQYQQESGIPVPRITPEDKRFYAGMAIFAGITTFIEVGYPIIMVEILSAVFVEALAGEIIAVGVEGGALLITRGKEVIKVGGKQLKEVTEYLVKSGRVKKGAMLDDLGKAFKEFLEEAGQRLTPTQKFKSSNLWDTARIQRSSAKTWVMRFKQVSMPTTLFSQHTGALMMLASFLTNITSTLTMQSMALD